jgi:seryl-tRNA synthetase
MLQINYIKQHTEEVKQKLAKKNFAAMHLVDEALQTDEQRKMLIAKSEDLKSNINQASKQIGMLMAKGQQSEAATLKTDVANWKAAMEPMENELQILENKLLEILYQIPNAPHALVPVGKLASDNEIVKEGGNKPTLAENAKPHWELLNDYNLINFELGNKITGAGFPVYIGQGAKLQRALVQYFLNYNTAAGYIEHQVPHLVNEASALGTGNLPDKEGQMYHATVDNFYLIPTSEIPLTNIYRNELLKESELPKKLTGYTPCFRREAGSYGSDVRGLNRLHQFDKVEIVQITNAETSLDTLNNMVAHVETLIQSLELPYRILRLCGGDMSFASAITYDFEVYSAAQDKWLEVSSVSNFENFQSNRLKLRYKNNEGKTTLCHTLNGSSLALPRIMAALIENNQSNNGIHLPKVLHNYFGAEKISS